jgi:hypothetical protein
MVNDAGFGYFEIIKFRKLELIHCYCELTARKLPVSSALDFKHSNGL